jgi:hypothetical protein
VSAAPEPRDPAVPAQDLLFPIVEDRLGPRLALVFGNEAPGGECPFYRAALCHHCDIGRGEGARFDLSTNRRRLAWFRARYAEDWPRIAHLVIYNSGSVLNPAEMAPALLDEVLGFARGLPALAAVSLDSREGFVTEARVAGAARALGAPRRLRVIIGIESADDAIRDGRLEKRMPRAAVERAALALGRAAREAAENPGAASIGLDVNVVVGGPGAAGGRAPADAAATARWAVALARAAGVPLDLNVHPYDPSARGAARFPGHPRPGPTEVVAAVEAMLGEIRAAGATGETSLFLGLHDEGHDTRREERARAISPLAAALARFHRDQDAAALRAALERERP